LANRCAVYLKFEVLADNDLAPVPKENVIPEVSGLRLGYDRIR